jgi:phosphoribosyl-dephospho-CoA transferase
MRVCAAAPFDPASVVESPTSDTRWQAHDLLRLRQLAHFDEEPAWVRDAFARAPFVVVRRARVAPGFVAVGVRGAARHERYGTWVSTDDIDDRVPPEALCSADIPSSRALPAFAAFDALRRDPFFASLVWGPTGSVGFELATSAATVTTESDLDLLIRMPNYLSNEEARHVQASLDTHAARAGVRIDAQLETPAGGVALAEYASGKARVMARHDSGPRLVADPWA